MYDDVAPSAMMFVDFFSRSAILSGLCESPDPLTQCTCLIEPHVLYCMCGFEDLSYANATNRFLTYISCVPPGMKTRNLVSSRRLLVGLVMVDAFWMIGEFFPRGRLLPSSTRAVCKLHSLFLIVLIGHANIIVSRAQVC